MDDNARPHQTITVEELLESEDITRMDWPTYSPDLNPIEHVWHGLGRRIAARLDHPENTQQLKQMLIEEWALLPQEMLHHLVLSMRRRCEATIAHRSPRSYNAELGSLFGSNCQKKQTEHSIRPVSSALFSNRYDSFKADRVQTFRAHWAVCS
ncbi:transposable element Tcb2 transposase [Trichonephila clavipes]|nr:transposable element Tcb2 transposase [Trichonephila clavipes]